MSAENFVNALADVAKDNVLDEYKHANSEIQWGVQYSQLRFPPSNYYSIYGDSKPARVASRLDPSHTATRAAMWINAISTRSRLNSLQETVSGGLHRTISNIWKETDLAKLAEEAEASLEAVKPKLTNEVASVNVEQMKEERLRKIKSGDQEFLVFTGPNGVGKDFLIGWLQRFLDFSGIPHNVTKMPNPEGALFPTIDKFLQHQLPLNKNAAQMLFLADALDTTISSATLGILNRHPSVESLVFGEENLQPASLALHPLFNSVFHVFIVDRHAAIAQAEVHKRAAKPRIFETNLEPVLEQQRRFAALTALPGHRWLNTDFEAKDLGTQITFSVNRLLCMVQESGVVQRRMVKMGMAENYVHANTIYEEKYWKFKESAGLLL